jgi:hypothetical protein
VTFAEIIVTVTGVVAIIAINWWFFFAENRKSER